MRSSLSRPRLESVVIEAGELGANCSGAKKGGFRPQCLPRAIYLRQSVQACVKHRVEVVRVSVDLGYHPLIVFDRLTNLAAVGVAKDGDFVLVSVRGVENFLGGCLERSQLGGLAGVASPEAFQNVVEWTGKHRIFSFVVEGRYCPPHEVTSFWGAKNSAGFVTAGHGGAWLARRLAENFLGGKSELGGQSAPQRRKRKSGHYHP